MAGKTSDTPSQEKPPAKISTPNPMIEKVTESTKTELTETNGTWEIFRPRTFPLPPLNPFDN